MGHGDQEVSWKRSLSIRMRPGPDGKSKSTDQNPEDPAERPSTMGEPEGGIIRDGPRSVRKKSKPARDSSGRENSQVRLPGRTWNISISSGVFPRVSGDANEVVPKFVAGVIVPSAIIHRTPDGPVFVNVSLETVLGLAICNAEAESTVAEIVEVFEGGPKVAVCWVLVSATKGSAVGGGPPGARQPLRCNGVFVGTYASVGGIPVLGRGRRLSSSSREGGSRVCHARLEIWYAS